MKSTARWAWVVWTNTHPSRIMNKICPTLNPIGADLCPDCRHSQCAKKRLCLACEPQCETDRYHYAGLSYEKHLALQMSHEKSSAKFTGKNWKAYMDYRDLADKRVKAKLRKAYERCERYTMELSRSV